jgi:hypothetical protein
MVGSAFGAGGGTADWTAADATTTGAAGMAPAAVATGGGFVGAIAETSTGGVDFRLGSEANLMISISVASVEIASNR